MITVDRRYRYISGGQVFDVSVKTFVTLVKNGSFW